MAALTSPLHIRRLKRTKSWYHMLASKVRLCFCSRAGRQKSWPTHISCLIIHPR